MCIVFWTVSHPGYQLIIASNRDEFMDRPALPAHWHDFAPVSEDEVASATSGSPGQGSVVSGRDVSAPAAGTWLGMTRDLRVGVLTNVREGFVRKRRVAEAPSRGKLVKDFLSPQQASTSVLDYLAGHMPQADDYDGFNLLLFRLHPPPAAAKLVAAASSGSVNATGSWGAIDASYLSNHPQPTLTDLKAPTKASGEVAPTSQVPEVGTLCRGMSNSCLSEPWPKVTHGEAEMQRTLMEANAKGEGDAELVKRLQSFLSRNIPLTTTESVKESCCLHPVKLGKTRDMPVTPEEGGRWYSTRVSTVILVRDSGDVTFVEKDIYVLDGNGNAVDGHDERRFHWNVLGRSGTETK